MMSRQLSAYDTRSSRRRNVPLVRQVLRTDEDLSDDDGEEPELKIDTSIDPGKNAPGTAAYQWRDEVNVTSIYGFQGSPGVHLPHLNGNSTPREFLPEERHVLEHPLTCYRLCTYCKNNSQKTMKSHLRCHICKTALYPGEHLNFSSSCELPL